MLVQNTAIETSLDKKIKPRYLGPMVIMTRNKGEAYIVAELDGFVWHKKVGAFRLIPYFVQHEIDLPGGIEEFIDISQRPLKELEDSGEVAQPQPDIWFEHVKHIPVEGSKTDLDQCLDDKPENLGLQ